MRTGVSALASAFASVICGTHVVHAQTLAWSPVRLVPIEVDGTNAASGRMTAADPTRGVIVSFGCHSPQRVFADTWEWGGSTWTPRDPQRVPPFRRHGVLVHDANRHRTVLFGGAWNFNLDDTWEWDGETWTQRFPSTSPSPRNHAAAAFDAARGVVVLFGGHGLGDTWEYDGVNWTQRLPAAAPSAREAHGMAYDEIRQRTVLFGGIVGNINQNTETWEWDGANWSLRATSGPPGGQDHVVVWDRQRQRVVEVGGGAVMPWFHTTREWDGTQWSIATTVLPFAAYPGMPAATDPVTGSAVVFAEGQRWSFAGAAWVPQAATPRTPDAGELENPLPMCTDTVRQRVMLYSNREGTWQWSGDNWVLFPASMQPGVRYASMAFDDARGVAVLFGGWTSNGSSSAATWEWNGSQWAAASPAASPSPRARTAMAFDAARQRMVLFGGLGPAPVMGPAPIYGDTWTYDGVTWSQGPAGPGLRTGHTLAYDAVRQEVVLFGGSDYNGALQDTWIWNGTAWAQRQPAQHPSARSGHASAFDPVRGEVLLSGGANYTQRMADTWSWNGITWNQLALALEARNMPSLAFDPVRGVLLMYGGETCVTPPATECKTRRDARALGIALAPGLQDLGGRCSAGVPPRLVTSTPYLGNSDFAVDIVDATPSALCIVGFATGAGNTTFGPCTWHLPLGAPLLAAVANAGGGVRAPVPLPRHPALRGVTFYAQGVVAAQPGAFLGFDATAARQIVIGD